MLELVLSSVAGLAVAAAIKGIPRGAGRSPDTGVQSRFAELEMERDILTKTIARLHHYDGMMPAARRSRLLAKYQYQLEEVTARIESGQPGAAVADPELRGRLASLDQSVSSINRRLDEISVDLRRERPYGNAGTAAEEPARTEEEPSSVLGDSPRDGAVSALLPDDIEVDDGVRPQIEVVAGTSGGNRSAGPADGIAQVTARRPQRRLRQTKPEAPGEVETEQAKASGVPEAPGVREPAPAEASDTPKVPDAPKVRETPKAEPARTPKNAAAKPDQAPLPEDSPLTESDDDDLEKIKREITSALNKLNEAEV